MAGFIYFVPGVHTRAEAELAIEGLSLGYAFPPAKTSGIAGFNPVASGPGETAGAVLIPHAEAEGAEMPTGLYLPDQQDWHKAPRAEFWIGRERDKLVRPVDLQRPELIPGHDVELGDGQSWHIPRIVDWQGKSAVPQRLGLDDAGDWQATPLERYVAITRDAERLWHQMAVQTGLIAPGDDERIEFLSEDDERELAVRVLAMNYRVSRLEVAMLGLLTTNVAGTLTRLLGAFIDWPTVTALGRALMDAKKNGEPATIPDGNGSVSGVPA